MISTVKKMS